MSRVRTAVVPAAGWGTRFLPASKAIPKEMIPVIDKPIIQYVLEEAVAAGIEDVLIVTAAGKEAIGDHFDRLFDLEASLVASGKTEQLDQVRALSELCEVHFVRQGEAKGLGHAVGVAERHVGREPFAVLLGDDFMVDDGALVRGLIETHDTHDTSAIALLEVAKEDISKYGCIDPDPDREGLAPNCHRFLSVVEKPDPAEAPSNLAVIGRYVFRADIFDAIRETPPGRGGEIQLTDAIDRINGQKPVIGYAFSQPRYDCGQPLLYLKATVELATQRADLGPEFTTWLKEFVETL